jgi:hypothetical protein
MLKRNNLGNCDSINEVVENCITNGSIVDDLIESNTKCESCMADPDSGLGTSISMSNGPLHIDDWPSLAALLPKY